MVVFMVAMERLAYIHIQWKEARPLGRNRLSSSKVIKPPRHRVYAITTPGITVSLKACGICNMVQCFFPSRPIGTSRALKGS